MSFLGLDTSHPVLLIVAPVTLVVSKMSVPNGLTRKRLRCRSEGDLSRARMNGDFSKLGGGCGIELDGTVHPSATTPVDAAHLCQSGNPDRPRSHSMTDANNLPPAGWFPDPNNAEQLRWWDGARWTQHQQPVPAAQFAAVPTPPSYVAGARRVQGAEGMSPASLPPSAPPGPGGAGKNKFAIAALVLGIMSILLAGSPVRWFAALAAAAAVAFGILAIRRHGEVASGRKRGISAIVLGALALLVSVSGSSQGTVAGGQVSLADAPNAVPTAATSASASTPVETREAPSTVPTTSAPATTPAPAPTQASSSAPAPEPTEETGPFGKYPAAEAAFAKEVAAASEKYDAAKTDLQRSRVMRTRNKNLYNIMGGLKVSKWVGVIKDVGANGEGKAYVDIEIADGVQVHTWNNFFSDMGDNTLIPESSSMFDTLVDAEPGDQVVFSGKFFRDSDATLRTTNLTEVFSVLTPEFLFDFSAISKP